MCQPKLVCLRACLLTFFHLFAPTCSSPKKPTWNEQVDISRSTKYPTGSSCLFTSPVRFPPVGLSWQLKFNVPPGLSNRWNSTCTLCRKGGVLYVHLGGLFDQSDLNCDVFSKDCPHHVIITNLNKALCIQSNVPATLATTSGKRNALTCSIYTPARALASGAYNPPVGPSWRRRTGEREQVKKS